MLGSWDLAIIGAYLVLLLGMGILLKSRADQGVGHFFLSGKRLPWWIAGTSMAASAFSADTPLYVTNITRAGGIGQNWEWWCYLIGGAFSVYFLARLWRRAGVLTDVELSELRYDGLGATILRGFRALAFSVIVNCVAMALVIKAIVTILGNSLGIDPAWLVPLCLAVTAVYSLLSGFWGVVLTDFIQFFLALAGAVLLAVAALAAVGGWESMQAQIAVLPQENNPLNILPRGQEGFWQSVPVMLALMFGVQWWAFINADGGGKIIQRQLACRDEREAARATLWFLVTHYVVRTWPWVIVALCSILLLPAVHDGESAYTAVMLQVLPEGLRGFMIATFLAAFMSTIDTQLNWGTSYFVNDFYARFVRPKADDRHLLMVSRLLGVAFLVLAGVMTLAADSVTGVFRFLLAMGAGVGPIYLLRWFWWRVNAWTELSAMILSMGLSTALSAAGVPLHPSLLITLSVTLPIAILVTLLTPPVSDEHLKRFVARTRPYGFWGKLRGPQDGCDPLSSALIGWGALTGGLLLQIIAGSVVFSGRLEWALAAAIASLPLLWLSLRMAAGAPKG
jgi:Na+/proline symporter